MVCPLKDVTQRLFLAIKVWLSINAPSWPLYTQVRKIIVQVIHFVRMRKICLQIFVYFLGHVTDMATVLLLVLDKRMKSTNYSSIAANNTARCF